MVREGSGEKVVYSSGSLPAIRKPIIMYNTRHPIAITAAIRSASRREWPKAMIIVVVGIQDSAGIVII